MQADDKLLDRKTDFRNRRRRRVNWRQAADLLGRGLSLEAAADRLACGVPVLRRNLRRSAAFRQRIQQAAEQERLRSQLRFMALGQHAAEQLRAAEKLDLRVLHWLAGQIGLGQAAQSTEIAARWELALGLTTPAQLSAEQARKRQDADMALALAELRALPDDDA